MWEGPQRPDCRGTGAAPTLSLDLLRNPLNLPARLGTCRRAIRFIELQPTPLRRVVAGRNVDAAGSLVCPDAMGDGRRRCVPVSQPDFESMARENLRAARREFPGQKPRVVSDDDTLPGTGWWIFVQVLCDGVGGELHVRKRKRVADD